MSVFLDPCNGVTCATGTVAVSALGICQCLEVRILQIRYALLHWKMFLSNVVLPDIPFLIMYWQCGSDSDCTVSSTQNGVCSGGQCTCGASGAVCSGTTPFCGKTDTVGTQATAADGNTNANCQVGKYFLTTF